MKQILHMLARFALLEFIAFLCVFVFLSNTQRFQSSIPLEITKSSTTNIPQTHGTNIMSPQPTEKSQSLLSQLASHNNKQDCWILYQGHIYNITSFFGSHPGGDTIMLTYCGGDATAGFNSKEENPPNPHSGSATALLQQFLIQ